MVKLHLLSHFPSETLSYCMVTCPFAQYPLTVYEGELLHYINTFHSNGTLSLNNQLNYSKLDTISVAPIDAFLRFYQFLLTTAQFTNKHPLWLAKSIADKEKAVINNMYDSSKQILSKKTETNSSFCREILFHGKEILSYCTTSLLNLNEKDHQTIACLAIKDIVSIYFPWSNIEEFIQICRKKQITRFKPDKSTDYDSSLRLVNIQELEHHWNYILKELLPTKQISNHHSQSDQIIEKEKLPNEIPVIKNTEEEPLTSNVNTEQSNKTPEPSPFLAPPSPPPRQEEEEQQQPIVDNCISNDNDISHLPNDIPHEINDILETIVQENELEISTVETKEPEKEEEDVSTINEENISVENKSLKKNQRRRRRNKLSFCSSKKRKRENLKTIENEEFWMKKFSVEPFSILLDRYQAPLDD